MSDLVGPVRVMTMAEEAMQFRDDWRKAEAELTRLRTALAAAEAEKVEAVKDERERIAAWIETQRNDIPANGHEFAAAIRRGEEA